MRQVRIGNKGANVPRECISGAANGHFPFSLSLHFAKCPLFHGKSVSFAGMPGWSCSFAIMKYRAVGTEAQRGSVAELAYAADLKSAAARLVGSSPTAPTK